MNQPITLKIILPLNQIVRNGLVVLQYKESIMQREHKQLRCLVETQLNGLRSKTLEDIRRMVHQLLQH